MPKIGSGDLEIELTPFVAEAIEQLGYFQVGQLYTLSARVARLWGETPYGFEKEGEQIKPIPEKPYYAISKEVWDWMTDKGRANPSHACKATLLRITFGVDGVRAAYGMDQMVKSGLKVASFQMMGVGQFTCDAARRFEGRSVGPNERIRFPLPECDREWCACNWHPSYSD